MLVLLGLGIGQFIAHRGASKVAVKPTPTPVVSATPRPLPTAVVMKPIVFPTRTPAATASPVHSASPRPSATPSVRPSAGVTASAAPAVHPTSSGAPSPSPHPSVAPTHTATPHPAHTRYPVTSAMLAGKSGGRPATAAPTAAVAAITEPPKKATPAPATPKPVPAKSAAPAKTAVPAKTAAPVRRPAQSATPHNPGAPSTLHSQAEIAQKVVRGYLTALIQGDERTAYHHLGGNAGDSGLSLSEETFIDHSAKISNLQAQPDASGVNIQAEIAAKHGLYFATYRVEYRNGRATIVSHDFIKP